MFMQFIKLLSLAMCFAVSAVAMAQDIKQEYYDDGKTVRYEYSYSDGQLNGLSKEFYETGELKAEMQYRSGKLIAKKQFLRDGRLEYDMKIVEDKRHETEFEYYQTGELFRQRQLVNGVREGLEKEYYTSGKTKAERNYKSGKRHGAARGYHRNGNLQGDWEFVDGLPVQAIIYYSSGEKWLVHPNFKDGNLHGESKEYDKEGDLIAERIYEDGTMIERRRRTGFWF